MFYIIEQALQYTNWIQGYQPSINITRQSSFIYF